MNFQEELKKRIVDIEHRQKVGAFAEKIVETLITTAYIGAVPVAIKKAAEKFGVSEEFAKEAYASAIVNRLTSQIRGSLS
jgi:hypothetical protein